MLNLLPSMACCDTSNCNDPLVSGAVIQSEGHSSESHKLNLITCLQEIEELEIFDCKAIDILLEYKWEMYAWKIHMIGFVTHVIYVLFFSAYVSTRFVYHVDTYN